MFFFNNFLKNLQQLVSKRSFWLYPFHAANLNELSRQIIFTEDWSPIAEQIFTFYCDVVYIIIIIIISVLWLVIRITVLFEKSNTEIIRYAFNHNLTIEIIWTIIPTIILILISIPSFSLLYALDQTQDAKVTIKVIGNQWYWTYEYPDYGHTQNKKQYIDQYWSYDSYMRRTETLGRKHLRLLEVDNRLYIPINHTIRVLVTSQDVIHSWAIPCLGTKMDASPGRLNITALWVSRSGSYYGQCSELCGINHGFMPICVQAETWSDYLKRLVSLFYQS